MASAAGCLPGLFYGDIVAKGNSRKGFEFGQVKHSQQHFFTSGDHFMDEVPKGHIGVAWLHGSKMAFTTESKVNLVDRWFMNGDVVTRKDSVSGKYQFGYILDSEVRTHLKVIDSSDDKPTYLYDVNLNKLKHINKWVGLGPFTDVAFPSGLWKGSISYQTIEIELLFEDGARCSVNKNDLIYLKEINSSKNSFLSYYADPFVGQKLKGNLKPTLQYAKWLKSTKQHCKKIVNKSKFSDNIQITVIIDKIIPKQLDIHWTYKGTKVLDKPPPKPQKTIKGKSMDDLKVIEKGNSSVLNIGYRKQYDLAIGDCLQTVDPSKLFDPKAACLKDKLLKPSTKSKHEPTSAPITRSRSKTRNNLKLCESSDSKNEVLTVEVVYTSSWNRVVWENGTTENGIRSTDLLPVGPVSLDYFLPGYFVLPVSQMQESFDYGVVVSADNAEKTCFVNWFKSPIHNDEDKTKSKPVLVKSNCEVSVYDLKNHPSFDYKIDESVRSHRQEDIEQESASTSVCDVFGLVKELKTNGTLVIKWANGNFSDCNPQEISKGTVLDSFSDDDDDYFDSFNESGSEDDFETVMLLIHSNLAKEAAKKEAEEKKNAPKEDLPTDSEKANNILDDIIDSSEGGLEQEFAFQQFNIVSEVPVSHHYAQKPVLASLGAFNKAVRKELLLFKTNLPDGILVRGFEDRLDLYSAMIFGPKETIYEDCVFMFDIMLPYNYPNTPPLFHYHSYSSERLNPNLYENGKVCVSLLGTWSGEGTELWSSKSNLVQVLLSIQGLILVSEPYFNEPGFEKQQGTDAGEIESRSYNEMALSKVVKSVTEICSRPPLLFKEEIKVFFSSRGSNLTSRLMEWMEISKSEQAEKSFCSGTVNITDQPSLTNENQTKKGKRKKSLSKKGSGKMFSKKIKLDTTTSVLNEDVSSQEHVTKKADNLAPKFPLLPMSRGCCLYLENHLKMFQNSLKEFSS